MYYVRKFSFDKSVNWYRCYSFMNTIFSWKIALIKCLRNFTTVLNAVPIRISAVEWNCSGLCDGKSSSNVRNNFLFEIVVEGREPTKTINTRKRKKNAISSKLTIKKCQNGGARWGYIGPIAS